MLRIATLAAAAACVLSPGADAFTASPALPSAFNTRACSSAFLSRSPLSLGMTMAASKPGGITTSDFKPKGKKEEEKLSPEWRMEMPEPLIESEVGADYMPLLTALKLGRYEEADQLTRDLLITIGGEATKKRGFVYYAEAPRLPYKDMMTIDRLWVAYSQGKFGYSVQKQIWNSKAVGGDFPKFVAQIEWTTGPCGGCDKICSGCPGTLKRWTAEGAGGNQYVYDLDKAKKGHLPLTSALRGTFLLKSLLAHKAFGSEPVMGNPLVKAVNSDKVLTGADAVTEPMQSMEELRFGASPYTANKKPWDV